MSNLLTLSYWFNFNPGSFLPLYGRIFYGLAILLTIFGFMAWFFESKNKKNNLLRKFWQKISNFSLTVGLVGLFLIFSREQGIAFFAMPFLSVLFVIGALVWFYVIVRYATVIMPQRKEEQKAKEQKEKYM